MSTPDRRATGRSHRIGIEFFAFIFAGRKHIIGQDAQAGPVARIEPKVMHASPQAALCQVNLSERHNKQSQHSPHASALQAPSRRA